MRHPVQYTTLAAGAERGPSPRLATTSTDDCPCGSKATKAAGWALLCIGMLMFAVAFWPGAAPLAVVRSSSSAAAAASAEASARAPAVSAPIATSSGSGGGSGSGRAAPKGKVLLELFVMSLCPDAKYCETEFAKILAGPLHDIVHVRTEYIQREDASGKMVCKHGDAECTGNLYQLCLAEHTPPEHNYGWFVRYLQCLWATGKPASDPAASATCMAKVGYSAPARAAAARCAAGPEGAELMRATAHVVAERRVVNSCTIAIDGERRCIRDGGEWRDCPGGSSDKDFVRSLCDAYRARTGKDADACLAAPSAAAAAAAAAAVASVAVDAQQQQQRGLHGSS